jgi:hypothetical protein
MNTEAKQQIPKFITRLMPFATAEEQATAAERYFQYLSVARRIHERLMLERIELDSSDKAFRDRITDINPDV